MLAGDLRPHFMVMARSLLRIVQGVWLDSRPVAKSDRQRKEPAVAVSTFLLGVVIFALFFGLVAACDRL